MTPYYADGQVTLYHGDALEVLRTLDPDSVDAVVTDPPYGLEFMGREWDAPWRYGFSRTGYTDGNRMARPNFGSTRNPVCRTCRKRQRGSKRCMCETPDFDETPADSSRLYGQWCLEWAREVIRVLKPGGHLLAFGGTRTVHRLTCAIEDAGFEIRDGIDWIYANGFPKSLDVSKAIDKAAGAEREVIGTGKAGASSLERVRRVEMGYRDNLTNVTPEAYPITAPATEDAKRWSGWGTALKPAREPIVVARKPLAGTVAQNVLAYGTGALNIDGCRVGLPEHKRAAGTRTYQHFDPGSPAKALQPAPHDGLGRWPSNLILSHASDCGETCVPGCPVAELDTQSGILTSGANPTRRNSDKFRDTYGEFKGHTECTPARGADSGGASRFFPVFRYEAKADSAERPRVNGIAHPTVKPLGLIRWLVRLVTPPGGVVLDPFAGSGTTAEACVLEGFRCVTVEREADYLPLIMARLSKPLQPVLDLGEAS